jgi:hypothetical protein
VTGGDDFSVDATISFAVCADGSESDGDKISPLFFID